MSDDAAEPTDSNWTVKNFPITTREAVIAAARAEGIPVRAWLDRACLRALERPRPELLPPGQQAANDGPTRGQQPDMSWIAAPVAAAREAKEAGFIGLSKEIARMAVRQVRAWQGPPPLKGPTGGQRRSLPGPTRTLAARSTADA